jgi:hypothetical protein
MAPGARARHERPDPVDDLSSRWRPCRDLAVTAGWDRVGRYAKRGPSCSQDAAPGCTGARSHRAGRRRPRAEPTRPQPSRPDRTSAWDRGQGSPPGPPGAPGGHPARCPRALAPSCTGRPVLPRAPWRRVQGDAASATRGGEAARRGCCHDEHEVVTSKGVGAVRDQRGGDAAGRRLARGDGRGGAGRPDPGRRAEAETVDRVDDRVDGVDLRGRRRDPDDRSGHEHRCGSTSWPAAPTIPVATAAAPT